MLRDTCRSRFGRACLLVLGSAVAPALPAASVWQHMGQTWHAEVTVDLKVEGSTHSETAEWQLEATDQGFCIRVHDVRRQQDAGPVDATFTPMQTQDGGWCRDPALRTFGSGLFAQAAAARGLTAGLPAEGAGGFTEAKTAILDLQQHLFGVLLFDAWSGGRHSIQMPDGSSLAINCRPQGAGGDDKRALACELDAGLLHAGMANAMSLIMGMDSSEMERLRAEAAPEGMASIVVLGDFAEGPGLPRSITWIPDALEVVPATRFTFKWTPGPAMAPELPLDPMRPWIEQPEPPPDATGSRIASYRATRAPHYPLDAIMAGEAGEVMLEVLVAPDGRVQTVQVMQSSGSAALDAAAQDDVAYWQFHPAMKDGVPVEQRVAVPVNFQFPTMPQP